MHMNKANRFFAICNVDAIHVHRGTIWRRGCYWISCKWNIVLIGRVTAGFSNDCISSSHPVLKQLRESPMAEIYAFPNMNILCLEYDYKAFQIYFIGHIMKHKGHYLHPPKRLWVSVSLFWTLTSLCNCGVSLFYCILTQIYLHTVNICVLILQHYKVLSHWQYHPSSLWVPSAGHRDTTTDSSCRPLPQPVKTSKYDHYIFSTHPGCLKTLK